MTIETSRLRIGQTDEAFNTIYPRNIRRLAEKHFTPVSVARTASEFLARDAGTRVLDIGSGAGKFCMVGAANTTGHFTGIEQRHMLVKISKQLSDSLGISNVTFINANITSISFNDYDAFYIYNSFYENIDVHDTIDDTVLVNPPLYSAYSMYTRDQLSTLPPLTRLATYHTSPAIIPSNFELIDSLHEGNLKLWRKVI